MDPNEDTQIDDSLNFDVGMKKKKKKKAPTEEAVTEVEKKAPSSSVTSAVPSVTTPQVESKTQKETETAPTSVSDFPDDEGLLPNIKKKPKKKEAKVETQEQEPETATTVTPSNASLDDAEYFGPERRKKRVRIDLAAFERDLMDGDDKNFESFKDSEADGIIMEDDLEETWRNSDREYTYKELLERAFRMMKLANPESGERKKYIMIPPQVQKEGTKKTVFANFSDICKRMRRNQEHVIQYIYSELGTSGSVDGNQRLIIKGRFMPNQIENVLRRYIVEYVTCKVCKSPETILTKENRLMFMQCEQCGASRSVMAIKTGFSAQVDRRRN